MILDRVLEGKYIYLRSVIPEDASFIVEIRNNAILNCFLHAVPYDIDKQKAWIQKQNYATGDYYFVIEDDVHNPIGLASIYNYDAQSKSVEFGRWISLGNAIQNVESVILSFDFAFNILNVDYVYMRTMIENNKVKNFWKHFGAVSQGIVYEMDLWLEKEIVTKCDYQNTLRELNTKLLRY